MRQSHDVSAGFRATMTSLHDKLSALLVSGKSAEAILSEMMSEVTRAFPRQPEPARDLIVEFLFEQAMTNRQAGPTPPVGDNVINFLEERGRRGGN